MSFLLQDLGSLAIATMIAPLLLYVPGLGLVRLLARSGLLIEGYWQHMGWATILGLSILPVFDALAIRSSGIPGMLLLNGLLALWGAPLLKGGLRTPSLMPFLLLAAFWWLTVAWGILDFDGNGALHQSLTAIDMVKHAAVVEIIARDGVPFSDPFFAREGVAGYYYYFYVWPAAIRWISGFHVMPAMAFGATTFWTGFGVVALLWRIMADADFIRPGKERRVLLLAALLCFVAGADLLFMLVRYLITHRIEPELDSWNTEIRMLATSTLWVPHHIMALIAAWTGMLLGARASRLDGAARHGLAIAAGVAFATMAGASIWISLTIAPLLAGWTIWSLRKRNLALSTAGIVALLLSLLQIHDILVGRAPDIFPIAFRVRPFTILFSAKDWATQFWCLILLPLNYAMEFGILMLGASAYYHSARTRAVNDDVRLVRALLVWSALTAFFVASFLQSVIINNDLGWRSPLFLLIPMMVWSLCIGQSITSLRQLGIMGCFLIVLGTAGTIWDLAGLRVIRAPLFPTRPVQLNSDPALTHALRQAYSWSDGHLPKGATLQQNPRLPYRAVDFGLYGHHWPAVADREAFLFGASRQAVMDRIAMLMPVFDRPIAARQLFARLRLTHSDYLLITRRDRVWRMLGGPPPELRCVYRTAILCIAPSNGV